MPQQIYIPNIFIQIPRNPISAVGLPLALGFLSGAASRKAMHSAWFQNLRTPPGRAPDTVFPIVWPVLYFSMGYASHLAVRALDTSTIPHHLSNASYGLLLYYTQLALNVAWGPIFFGARKTGLALIDSTLLACMVFYMTKLLDGPTRHRATYCLLPYSAWLAYATYLNGGIWWLNIGRRPPKEEPDSDEDI
ncbi:hypothetical protein AMATHDRAFT_1841 [Amanita thiersii Skay4041]|uniref:TspO/MBR-related protein n=1 Tax=Amanita thiersii Skay4041 TaxID=703135 RepID=A0A2A9NRQ9_9AGAR|nr:hypothetical protein AMATHDRAFT_1841 [Amanita thiersii Skay4041]